MRKLGIKPGIGLLVGLLSVATLMAAPASARAHHHRHNHHHGGGGIVCGPGTVSSGGMCVPTGPTGPVGNSNVTITPNNVTMNLDGTFASSIKISGLPPSTAVTANPNAVPCGNGTAFDVNGTTANTDALGRIQGTIFIAATPGCVPGTYPIIFTEANSPFQSFTGFITLHF